MLPFPFRKAAWLAAPFLIAACLFETERPATTGGRGGPTGSAQVRIKAGPVGALAKGSGQAAIELAELYITLAADNENPIHDTIPLSGNGANTVSRTFSALAANKTWSVSAYSRDARGQTIHSGSASFSVQSGGTTRVDLNLPSMYSMLMARFYPIDDSVTRCQLQVDGSTVGDTLFPAQTMVGDTVRLEYDYLYVGYRRIAFNVYGIWEGIPMLLYSGDTSINIVSGENARYDLKLVWRGPGVYKGTANMQVALGAVGWTDIHGRLLTSKNQDPVFTSAEGDMGNSGAPGMAYRDTVHAMDPDQDSLSYSLLTAPPGMTLADSIVSWTPDSASQNSTVAVLVQDGKGGRDTLEWNITLYQSSLSGFITSDITLTKANSPYWVTGNVLVREGVTMTIEPGARLVFGEGKGLQINGSLIARGTASDSIVFTSTQPSSVKWARILFADSSRDAVFDSAGNYLEGSILEYCRIEYGGRGVSGMVQMENAGPFVNRNDISFSDSRGIVVLGVTTISNCAIRRNQRGGISYSGGGGAIANNLIDSNVLIYGSWEDGVGIASRGRVAILNNIVTNNVLGQGDGASAIRAGNHGLVSGNIFAGNSITNGWRAMTALFEGGDSIKNNIFRNNENDLERSSELIFLSSSNFVGNTVEGNSSSNILSSYSSTLANNRFAGNNGMGSYLFSVNNSTISMNSFIGNTNPASNASVFLVDNNTRINNNNFQNPTVPYELSNTSSSTSPNVDAANNWWGTADEAAIQERIFDWFDDASKGIVNYRPYLAAPDTGAPAL